jgi:hypothetical protein
VSARRRIVVHGGDRRFPLAQGVEALPLTAAMSELERS